jgi:hypothetical protein
MATGSDRAELPHGLKLDDLELPQPEPNDTKAKASKAAATRDQSERGQRNKPR